jgi:hypothetical protein
MIPVPANPLDAQWTNLAPSASVTVSSTRDASSNRGVIDRRVLKDSITRYWTSAPGQKANQWVLLSFPVPIDVRAVRLYNPRQGDTANSSLQVLSTVVELCADAACSVVAASTTTGALAVTGTLASFQDVQARAVRVRIGSMSGTFFGAQAAGLAEIEVIARGGGAGSPGDTAPLAPQNLRVVGSE